MLKPKSELKIKLWPILDVLGRNEGIDKVTRERLYESIKDVPLDEIKKAINEDIKEYYKQLYIEQGDDAMEAGKIADRICGSRTTSILTGRGNSDTIEQSEPVEPLSENKMSRYLTTLGK